MFTQLPGKCTGESRVAQWLGMAAQEAKVGVSELSASLVYRVSSRTPRATQRNYLRGEKKNKNKIKQMGIRWSYLALSSCPHRH